MAQARSQTQVGQPDSDQLYRSTRPGGGPSVAASRAALSKVLEGPARVRLGEADTAVEFVTPADGDGFLLVLSGDDCAVRDLNGYADATLVLQPRHFDALADGCLPLQDAILAGDVTFTGGVRPLLSMWPVVEADLRSSDLTAPVPSDVVPGPFTDVAEENAGDFWAVRGTRLHKRFKQNAVLDDVSFSIPPGMITTVLGPSGTGKSVLMKHVNGLFVPDSGNVVVQGNDLATMGTHDLLALRRNIGVLFQDGALWGSMSVFDNVALPLRQHTDLSEAEIERTVLDLLAHVGMLAAASKSPGQLSGGMRKRVGFARALVLDPEIIIFDEPDSGLDPVRTALLCTLLARVHAELGGTYIIVTHNISIVRQIADYVVVLWKGKVVESGPARAVLASPDPFVRQFLAGDTDGPLGMD